MTNIPTRINKIIGEFVQGVNKILGSRVKKIILYGSYARGDFNESSDIDIMILTNLSDDEIFEYKVKVWDYAYYIEYGNNFEIMLSPLIRNIDKLKIKRRNLYGWTNKKRIAMEEVFSISDKSRNYNNSSHIYDMVLYIRYKKYAIFFSIIISIVSYFLNFIIYYFLNL